MASKLHGSGHLLSDLASEFLFWQQMCEHPSVWRMLCVYSSLQDANLSKRHIISVRLCARNSHIDISKGSPG